LEDSKLKDQRGKGFLNSEVGMRKSEKWRGYRIRKWECGLRPIGAYAYAPVGSRKLEVGRQKTDGRGQRAESREQKTEDRSWKINEMQRKPEVGNTDVRFTQIDRI
jgi:hypothetical protein